MFRQFASGGSINQSLAEVMDSGVIGICGEEVLSFSRPVEGVECAT